MNMKRIIIVLISITVALGVFAGCRDEKEPLPSASPTAAPSDLPSASPDDGKVREIIDEASFTDLSHRVFTENQFDTLISRHSSLQYVFTYAEKPEWNNTCWETGECLFEDWPGLNYARYYKNRTYYKNEPDGEGQASTCCGILVVADEYDPFYKVFGVEENQFLDREHEFFEKAFKEDGMIHILTVYDGEQSRKVVEGTLRREYDGEIIHAELVVNAENCELVSNSLSAEKDGKTGLVYSIEALYDTEEPSSCRTLRAEFETVNKPMMTVDVTVDKDTENEYRVSLTMPKGSTFTVDSDEGSAVFSDADYLSVDKIINWDEKSDLSVYVLTNPSDAVYNRFYTLSLEALKLRKQVYGIGDVTMEALVNANLPESVFKNHETAYVESHSMYGTDWFFCYKQGLYYESNYGDYENLIDSDGNFCRRILQDGSVKFSVDWFAMSEEEMKAAGAVRPEDLSTPINKDTTATEKIVNVIDNGNGTLTVITRMNEADTRKALEAKNNEEQDRYVGAVLEVEYTISAETLEILTSYEYLVLGDTRMFFDMTAVCYDVDITSNYEDMLARKVKHLTTDGEETKTVNVIYDAGTQSEIKYTLTIPKDDYAYLHFRDGYGTPYADPEKTALFDGTPDESGCFNLYLFPGE